MNFDKEIMELERSAVDIDVSNTIADFEQDIDWENSPPSLEQITTLGILKRNTFSWDNTPTVEYSIHFDIQKYFESIEHQRNEAITKMAHEEHLTEKNRHIMREAMSSNTIIFSLQDEQQKQLLEQMSQEGWNQLDKKIKNLVLMDTLRIPLTKAMSEDNTYKQARLWLEDMCQQINV